MLCIFIKALLSIWTYTYHGDRAVDFFSTVISIRNHKKILKNVFASV